MDSNANGSSNSLKELESKMNSFSSILEKFGLDIITKMGQTNMKVTQLTDMVEELSKSTDKLLQFMGDVLVGGSLVSTKDLSSVLNVPEKELNKIAKKELKKNRDYFQTNLEYFNDE